MRRRIFSFQHTRSLVHNKNISKELGDFKDSILNFQLTHGVKAIKICGSCDELRDNSDQIKGFEEYCGKNVYGNNETVTGLMLVPTDPTTMEMKAGGLDVSDVCIVIMIGVF